jgi:GDP-4-dehydro-6-deoxy-D-mannose reductase
MRAVVIGADGFAGRWLLRHLADAGDAVAAMVGPRFRPPLEGSAALERIAVRDAAGVARFVQEERPDAIYYLAGISRAGDRDELDAAVGVSIVGSLNALLGCARLQPAPRMLFVSTGYVYRGGTDPVDEASPTDPQSIYAAAKLGAERALLTLGQPLGVDVIIVRPFNHVGPGQTASFVVPSLARQIAAGAGGTMSPRVQVMDPAIVRDFSDVRDVVAAYRILVTSAESGAVYNIASGHGTSVADLAGALARLAGVSIEVASPDNGRAREEAPVLVGDASRLRSLGWRPRYSLDETLGDVLSTVQLVRD